MLAKIIPILFPKRCPYCHAVILEDEYACADCIENFPEDPIIGGVIGGYPCVSSFYYMDEYRRAFHKFKFRNKKQYGSSFAVSIANDIRKVYNDIEFDCITCVPMHPNKLEERGYNQAEILAREIGKILDIKFEHLIRKIKDNKTQHTLNLRERKLNVRGAYAKDKNAEIKGKTVLLCDDLITTGNTIGECARTLEKAGAKVYCVTMLRR